MKLAWIKTLTFFLSLAIFTLVGLCGNEKETSPNQSSETQSSTSSSTSGITDCNSINWADHGNVEVIIDVSDPSNAKLCSRNGGTGSVSILSGTTAALVYYTPTTADITGTLGWDSGFSNGNCIVFNSCENLITFEVILPVDSGNLTVDTCGMWHVQDANDTTILRSTSSTFDLSTISADGTCDACTCGSCGTTEDDFDTDTSIPINSGKAYFIISGYSSCTSFKAWSTSDDADFKITW